MESDPHRSPCKVSCVLCKTSDETEITGALSSKQNIAAHQNCLLFASGIYCKNSPTYDDLFGFDVKDVEDEQRRGQKLKCYKCNKRGATAGCDVKRCKRSYHYPCAIEDGARPNEDRFKLFCKLHVPKSDETRMNPETSLPEASMSGVSRSRRRNSISCDRPELVRRDSNSSAGSLEGSLLKKIKWKPVVDSDDDTEVIHSELGPIESDLEDCTSPEPHNRSTPEPKRKRPREKLSPSATDSLNEGLTSDQKACGSADRSEKLHDRSESDSPKHSSEVETPKRKRKKSITYSDDEVVLVVSDSDESEPQKKPSQSTPVPEKRRLCEKRDSSAKGADDDDDDTDIDSDDNKSTTQGRTKPQWHIETKIPKEESQSLLLSGPYHINVPCNVIVESDNSLELSSSASAAPGSVCISPGSVAVPKTPSKSRTPHQAPTTGTVVQGSADSAPNQDQASERPSGRPVLPQHSGLTVDKSTSTVQTPDQTSTFDHTTEQKRELSSPGRGRQSPDRPAASGVCGVEANMKSSSNAVKFWTKVNQAGWTKEIFSELQSQLSSLGERVQSQNPSHEDCDVALKVLEGSGQLPHIIAQLEQDLEKQEQDLQRKKAALRDAKAVLGV